MFSYVLPKQRVPADHLLLEEKKTMLTLFACPKPFTDPHIALIQRNAIRSWTMLRPKPEIILVGGEHGIADVAEELGATHLPDVLRNEFGTPLLNDVFAQVERRHPNSVFCYVNSDIILMSDFMNSIQVTAASKDCFMLGGRPWNLDVNYSIDFRPGWENELRRKIVSEGVLRHEDSCDMFAYTAGLWCDLPPFAIGRCYFDNALMWLARRSGGALVDATETACAIHQSHGYALHLQGTDYLKNPEAQKNRELAGGRLALLNWRSATHALRGQRVQRKIGGSLYLWHICFQLVWCPLWDWTRPFRHRLGLRFR